MSALETKYGILVGVDGSVESEAAIRFAAREAVIRHAPLTLMHVVAPIPDWPTPSRQAEIAEAWEENARDVIEQAGKTAWPLWVNPRRPTCAPKWSIRPSCPCSSALPRGPK
jgi:nucleotide-binding universal stress UspA family protein